jgi:hypothetical protein
MGTLKVSTVLRPGRGRITEAPNSRLTEFKDEPHKPTKARRRPACQDEIKTRGNSFSATNHPETMKSRLRQTEHPNAMPTSSRLSSVNGEETRGRFNPRYVRAKLE